MYCKSIIYSASFLVRLFFCWAFLPLCHLMKFYSTNLKLCLCKIIKAQEITTTTLTAHINELTILIPKHWLHFILEMFQRIIRVPSELFLSIDLLSNRNMEVYYLAQPQQLINLLLPSLLWAAQYYYHSHLLRMGLLQMYSLSMSHSLSFWAIFIVGRWYCMKTQCLCVDVVVEVLCWFLWWWYDDDLCEESSSVCVKNQFLTSRSLSPHTIGLPVMSFALDQYPELLKSTEKVVKTSYLGKITGILVFCIPWFHVCSTNVT